MCRFSASSVSSQFETMSPYSRTISAVDEYETFENERVLGVASQPRVSLSSSGTRGAKVHARSFMYICCQCNDGPKVYNVQPVCIICDHKACSYCAHVK